MKFYGISVTIHADHAAVIWHSFGRACDTLFLTSLSHITLLFNMTGLVSFTGKIVLLYVTYLFRG